ncbi:MAG TPA: DMT family transporter [Chroococcidiopsis sp.]
MLIFAASSAVTRKITELGAMNLVNGRNPISLCNVLFAGNLCALVTMLLIFGHTWNRQALRQLTRRDWLGLVAIAILSGALGPGLIFSALDHTSVTNVVLIGRLEPVLTLALSILFLRTRGNLWTIAGAIATFLGVATTSVLSTSERMIPLMGGLLHLGLGELQTAIAALVLAIAAVFSRRRLQHIPLGIFSLVRVGVGTAVFFVLALQIYGAHHFSEIFSPFLWRWMLLYGAVIVVAGQLCWLTGLRRSGPAQINLANSVNPVGAIAAAYLILGEVPSHAQYLGGAVIVIGIVLSGIGSLREARTRQPQVSITAAQSMMMLTGFRGI